MAGVGERGRRRIVQERAARLRSTGWCARHCRHEMDGRHVNNPPRGKSIGSDTFRSLRPSRLECRSNGRVRDSLTNVIGFEQIAQAGVVFENARWSRGIAAAGPRPRGCRCQTRITAFTSKKSCDPIRKPLMHKRRRKKPSERGSSGRRLVLVRRNTSSFEVAFLSSASGRAAKWEDDR